MVQYIVIALTRLPSIYTGIKTKEKQQRRAMKWWLQID